MCQTYSKKLYWILDLESKQRWIKRLYILQIKCIKNSLKEDSAQNHLNKYCIFYSIPITKQSLILSACLYLKYVFTKMDKLKYFFVMVKQMKREQEYGLLLFWGSKNKSSTTLKSKRYSTKREESIDKKFLFLESFKNSNLETNQSTKRKTKRRVILSYNWN